ncbi:MAG: XRE family transcriptional regulator [Megasphaera cerevisiae]|nr:XRE family transcriptional regulator [Megasphaera cerevisiae]MCI1749814.1 XRE family transcriptional regulator [Megasphaera cerevisiae]SKA09638.1 transcriptional regulator, XRE family with cupin sensor [Megasphaera cerevisiae DSM 20462]
MIHDMNAGDPVKEIGKILKKIRFERNLTLDNVSTLTGVSKTMLGQIERGVSVPTISVLWKIAKGLQISLSTLFNEPTQQYTPANILEDMQPVYDENNQMLLYNIFPFNPFSGFEYFYIILEPGAIHYSDPHRNSVEEYIIVTEGTLTLQIGEQLFTMEAPSKINFHSNVTHCYANHTDQRVVFQNIMKY